MPGRIIAVEGKTATVDFWGTQKTVRLEALTESVAAGDYVVCHEGSAERRIAPSDIADTLGLYEVLLCEAGEDPIAADCSRELEEGVLELTA
jgi:hydrogenase expression/formation protein HypC